MENRKHKKGDKLNELQVCKNVKSPNHEHVNQYIILFFDYSNDHIDSI